MAGPNGGYRRPNNPAPVSGPGQLSQRTDGGPQQVQADMSGMPYGENAEFNTMQSMAPMSASPSARSPRASARSAKSAGGGMSATPLFAATQRPDEPVTAGAPLDGPGDGPAMIDIVTAWQEEAARNIAVSEEEDGGNVITDAIGFVWDRSLGPIFDGLFWATEKGVQVGASVAWMSSGMSAEEAWEASQPGVLDPTMVDYARKTYGDTTIDVILEARAASESDDPNAAIAEVWDKYSTANDLEKLSILEQALSLSAYDQNTMDAITYLSASETGSIGNIFSWSFNSMLGIDPLTEEGVDAAQSRMFSATRNTVNVLALFAFDPLLSVGRIGKLAKLYKYGLSKLDPSDVDKAFQGPRVKRFFDTLGAGLTKADEAETPAEAAQIMNSLRSQYKNFLPAESLDALRWSGVRSGEDAAVFFKDAQYLELLTKGQMAKRGDQITIPHMVIASSLVKRASLVARGLTYDGNAAKNIDEIFGAGVSGMIPEEVVPVIIKKLAEPSGDKFVGRMLSDFVFAKDTARRTFLVLLLVR
jgi:hypothetical protein